MSTRRRTGNMHNPEERSDYTTDRGGARVRGCEVKEKSVEKKKKEEAGPCFTCSRGL